MPFAAPAFDPLFHPIDWRDERFVTIDWGPPRIQSSVAMKTCSSASLVWLATGSEGSRSRHMLVGFNSGMPRQREELVVPRTGGTALRGVLSGGARLRDPQ